MFLYGIFAGTMVCCYLLYSGQKATADEALKFYGTKRTHDEKGILPATFFILSRSKNVFFKCTESS